MENIRFIHQILIQSDGEIPEKIPEMIAKNIASVRELYPDAQYKFYSGNEIRSFLKTNFDTRVLHAYDTLQPYAYKCDLARLCLLYVYGGLYVDLGIKVLFPLKIDETIKMLFFRCPLNGANHPWDVENSIMYSADPMREEFKVAIDIICDNVKNKFYGINSLAPTGPGVIGRALAIVGDEDEYYFGYSSVSNTPLPINFFNYILPDGTFTATRTKNSQLDVILKSGNSYNHYWDSKTVYGEDLVYNSNIFKVAKNPKVNKKSKNKHNDNSLLNSYSRYDENDEEGVLVPCDFSEGDRGIVIFGPYKPILKGTYKVTLSFTEGSNVNGMKVDIHNGVDGVFYETELQQDSLNEKNEFSFIYNHKKTIFDGEIRLHSHGEASGGFKGVRFSQISADEIKQQDTSETKLHQENEVSAL